MNLSNIQPVICPYCGEPAEFIPSEEYYNNGHDYGWMYICRDCDATCGTHRRTGKPLGTLANKELRGLRMQCHRIFDRAWRSKKMSRKQAYRWLRDLMGMTPEQAHIGQFREGDCRKLLDKLATV